MKELKRKPNKSHLKICTCDVYLKVDMSFAQIPTNIKFKKDKYKNSV